MQPAEYKFERFSNPQFPIYLSSQSGRELLVKIHHHTSAELIQIMQGRVRLLAGTARRDCVKGDVIFLPPSVVHEVTSLTEDAAIRGVIYELSLVDAGDLRLGFAALLGSSQRTHYAVGAQEDGHAELCRLIDAIHADYGNDSMAGRMCITASLLQIQAQLIQRFALEESAADRNYAKIQPVLAYLQQHYAEKIRISQLSRMLHVCDDRLIRLFRDITGQTPIAYLTNLRIEACMKLLAGTDLSLSAIAEQTGFGSETYMTRVFRQKLNTTPGKYRKK